MATTPLHPPARVFPTYDLPALNTQVSCVHTLSDERWHPLLGWLAQQGIALEPQTVETPYALVDSTRVGYATPSDPRFRRGDKGLGGETADSPYPLIPDP